MLIRLKSGLNSYETARLKAGVARLLPGAAIRNGSGALSVSAARPLIVSSWAAAICAMPSTS